MPLDPQVASILQTVNDPSAPAMHTLPLADIRQMVDAVDEMSGIIGVEPIGNVMNITIPGTGGELPLRVYTPSGSGPFPVLLFIHGGGWIAGSIAGYDNFCRSMTAQSACIVVSVGYRLAPEYPYPAGLEDCYTAASWLAENATSLHGDPSRLAIGGDSSGGTLATMVTMLARDRQGPSFRYQVLLQPITDYYLPGTVSSQKFAHGYLLTKDLLALYWRLYLPAETEPFLSTASPLRAKNLSGLPPALVITAEFDILRDEGESYAKRLQAAGVSVLLKRYEGTIHPFMRLAGVLEQSKDAVNFTSAQLRATLD